MFVDCLLLLKNMLKNKKSINFMLEYVVFKILNYVKKITQIFLKSIYITICLIYFIVENSVETVENYEFFKFLIISSTVSFKSEFLFSVFTIS